MGGGIHNNVVLNIKTEEYRTKEVEKREKNVFMENILVNL